MEHDVAIIGCGNLLQPVAYGCDEKLHTLQCLQRCRRCGQSAAGCGSLLGGQPGVVNDPACLCDFALDDLEPRRQKALAVAMGDHRSAQMAAL